MNTAEHWHLSKSIPVSIIFTLVVYGVSAIWMASKLDERLNNVEKQVAVQALSINEIVKQRGDNERQLSERIVRLETVIADLKAVTEKLNDKLDRLQTKGN